MRVKNFHRIFRKSKKTGVTLLMIIIIGIMLFPYYMLVNNSFKTLRALSYNSLALANPPTLDNYITVIERTEYFRRIINNFIIMIPSLAFIVLFGAMAGYIIARRPSRATRFIYIYIILGIAMPSFTILYPHVRLISALGLMNNYLGLILIYVGLGMSMSTFMFNGFFGGAPKELEESAKIDGASLYRTFFTIYFPLSTPTAATIIMLQSLGIWSDETRSTILMSQKVMRALMPSLYEFYGNMVSKGIMWHQIFAYSVLCIIPMVIIFFLVNRYLISGIAEGALKG